MMQPKLLLISIVIIISVNGSFAQNRKVKSNQQKPQSSQPTALDPGQQRKEYAPKPSRKSGVNSAQQAEQEFYERMAKLEKTKRKNEKLSQQPQYSDPMYFGHKRPPKKRKPGKMKYCSECGIRH